MNYGNQLCNLLSEIVGKKEKYKVALLVPNYIEAGGDARVVKVQAQELKKRGHDVTIFTLNSDISPSEVPVIALGMPNNLVLQRIYRIIFPLNIVKTLYITSKLKSFDVTISHLYPMTWIGTLTKRLYGVKHIYWYHGIDDPKNFKGVIHHNYIKAFNYLTKLSINKTDKIVAVSYFGKKCVKDFFNKESTVIYNEIETRFHTGVDGSRLREAYGIGDSPVILSVGRVMPQKGFHLLLETFFIIKKDIPDIKLFIVGQKTYLSYLMELEEKCDDSVFFPGYIKDEMSEYYGMCNVYATCSLRECHNLPILEAQACGKPVVAFNIPPFDEEVNKNGILVAEGDLEGFANACIDLIKCQV